jgi:thioredoxin 1
MASPNVHIFTDQNFEDEVLKSSMPVLIHFAATWCGPCKQLAPIIEWIADDYAGKINVGKLDIDDAPETARKYGVRSVPTCLVFQGGRKVGTQAGLTNRETLLKLLGVY